MIAFKIQGQKREYIKILSFYDNFQYKSMWFLCFKFQVPLRGSFLPHPFSSRPLLSRQNFTSPMYAIRIWLSIKSLSNTRHKMNNKEVWSKRDRERLKKQTMLQKRTASPLVGFTEMPFMILPPQVHSPSPACISKSERKRYKHTGFFLRIYNNLQS